MIFSKIGRIKRFGSIWESKLEQYVHRDSLSMRVAAKRLNVDTKTVISHIRLIGNSCLSDKINDGVNEALQTECRQKWLQLIKANPSLSKTALRRIDGTTFSWLYRHDRDWLNGLNYKAEIITPKSRVDWINRDKEILSVVIKAVNELLNPNLEPQRITIGKIGKVTDLRSLLEKHLKKMPQTKRYIEASIETIEDYQRRRIKWHVRNKLSCGDIAQGWDIARLAGIRKDCPIDIETIINEETVKMGFDFTKENL